MAKRERPSIDKKVHDLCSKLQGCILLSAVLAKNISNSESHGKLLVKAEVLAEEISQASEVVDMLREMCGEKK